MDTRIWICPALCGCEIQMNAQWLDPQPIIDGQGRKISYRLPPDINSNGDVFVNSMSIVNVCSTHAPYTKVIPDVLDFFGGIHPKTGTIYQYRGIIKLPSLGSDAENLMSKLYFIHGQGGKSGVCGCYIYNSNEIDPKMNTSKVVVMEHPIHTVKCPTHPNDTNHVACLAENTLYSNTMQAFLQDNRIGIDEMDAKGNVISRQFQPGMAPTIYFDAQRKLHVKAPIIPSNLNSNITID